MDNKHLMVIYMLSAEIAIVTEQFYALTCNIKFKTNLILSGRSIKPKT